MRRFTVLSKLSKSLACESKRALMFLCESERIRLVRRIYSSRSKRHLSAVSGFFTDSWARESLKSSFVGCFRE
uniref:Uncharacterized protein n=1 Tax=Hyaloperonospora arabidopsidis (strain Emoy2) TaxID=559515 RepID=M4BL86_HYAAE